MKNLKRLTLGLLLLTGITFFTSCEDDKFEEYCECYDQFNNYYSDDCNTDGLEYYKEDIKYENGKVILPQKYVIKCESSYY